MFDSVVDSEEQTAVQESSSDKSDERIKAEAVIEDDELSKALDQIRDLVGHSEWYIRSNKDNSNAFSPRWVRSIKFQRELRSKAPQDFKDLRSLILETDSSELYNTLEAQLPDPLMEKYSLLRDAKKYDLLIPATQESDGEEADAVEESDES